MERQHEAAMKAKGHDMTTEVEQATTTLNSLLDQRDELVARAAKFNADRQAVAYAAHTGDKTAQDKLRKLNDETVLHNAKLEGIDAAIAEANSRLASAQRNEAATSDREQAEALRAKLNRFVELALLCDDCILDFLGAAKELQSTLDDIHALGCASPNSAQMRVLATLAIKSFVMQIPWTAKEWEHLAPNQRKTFRELAENWAAQISQHINTRLGEQPNKTEAA
jgi:hypothetical protein